MTHRKNIDYQPLQTNISSGVVKMSLSLMGLGSAQRAMPDSTKSILIHRDSQAMEQSQ